MTYGSTHPAQIYHSDTGVHVVTWTLSFLGVLAAMIGAWIALAPSDGAITVTGRTWAASDLAGTWDAWLLIVGGGVAAVGMTISAVRDWQHDASRWLVAAEALLAVVGVIAVAAGIALLM